jgi:hypothetical protein
MLNDECRCSLANLLCEAVKYHYQVSGVQAQDRYNWATMSLSLHIQPIEQCILSGAFRASAPAPKKTSYSRTGEAGLSSVRSHNYSALLSLREAIGMRSPIPLCFVSKFRYPYHPITLFDILFTAPSPIRNYSKLLNPTSLCGKLLAYAFYRIRLFSKSWMEVPSLSVPDPSTSFCTW